MKKKAEWNIVIVADVLHTDIFASKFELQSSYNVHFRSNRLGKRTNILIPSAIT